MSTYSTRGMAIKMGIGGLIQSSILMEIAFRCKVLPIYGEPTDPKNKQSYMCLWNPATRDSGVSVWLKWSLTSTLASLPLAPRSKRQNPRTAKEACSSTASLTQMQRKNSSIRSWGSKIPFILLAARPKLRISKRMR